MDYRLGRLPAKMPVGLRELGHYIAGDLPQAPPEVALPRVTPDADGTPWGILGNDKLGDCGVAGCAHLFMADASVTGEPEPVMSTQDVVSYYLDFTSGQDTGVVLSDFLAHVRAEGFLGRTVSAYAPVGVHDIPSLHFTVNAYGGAYCGIKVTQAMMTAFSEGRPWDLRVLASPVVGGHCVPVVAYDSNYLTIVTWGKPQFISYSAWHYLSDEAWAVITGEFAAKGDDGRGISLASLQADLDKLGAS